jgi:hypothetical protein
MADKKKSKLITPRNVLKEKAGDGGIPANLLKQAQDIIENNDADFKPIAREYLDKLTRHAGEARQSPTHARTASEWFGDFIMPLKANGAMFKYELITMIADVVMTFLDKIDTVNTDALDIVDMHNRILSVILKNDLKGSGGKEGVLLTRELADACARYYKKYGISEG